MTKGHINGCGWRHSPRSEQGRSYTGPGVAWGLTNRIRVVLLRCKGGEKKIEERMNTQCGRENRGRVNRGKSAAEGEGGSGE